MDETNNDESTTATLPRLRLCYGSFSFVSQVVRARRPYERLRDRRLRERTRGIFREERLGGGGDGNGGVILARAVPQQGQQRRVFRERFRGGNWGGDRCWGRDDRIRVMQLLFGCWFVFKAKDPTT